MVAGKAGAQLSLRTDLSWELVVDHQKEQAMARAPWSLNKRVKQWSNSGRTHLAGRLTLITSLPCYPAQSPSTTTREAS